MTTTGIKAPPVQAIDPGLVGSVYHVGVGSVDGTRIYGYLLAKGTKLVEHTDTQRKDALTSYSSPNLTDRDITNWPRESQGDFSGGGGQVVYIDPKRYWDGELDTRTAGFLKLRPKWLTFRGNPADSFGGLIGDHIGVLMASAPLQPPTPPYHPAGGLGGPPAQRMQAAVAYTNNDGGVAVGLYYLYDAVAGTWTRKTDAGIAIARMSGDVNALYATNGAAILQERTPTGAWFLLRNDLVTHNGIWAIDLGNAGYWLYYNPNRAGFGTEGQTLRRIDLTPAGGFPDALVPWGAAFHNVIDICAYSSGIAILTATPDGCEVWFHDNSTATRMVTFKSFQAQGICNCMGVLYLVLAPVHGAGLSPSILVAISGGSVTTLFEFVPPLSVNGAAVAAGRRVLFMGVYDSAAQGNDLYEYDVITGNLSRHASIIPSAGSILTSTARGGILAMGDSAVVGNVPLTTGTADLYAETSVTPNAFHAVTFMHSGYHISSRFDFQTPGLTKLFRRVTVKHRPLQVGESIQLDVIIDADPSQHVYGTTPATATVTNTALGSSQTEVTFPINTQGQSLYWVLALGAGTAGVGGVADSSTPVVFNVSTEISVPFVWEFTVDCSSRRMTLDEREDEQQLRGEDLSGFLRYLWLTGQPFVFYHPRGETWNAVMESLQGESSGPMKMTGDSQRRDKDFEGWLAVSIRALP